MLKRALLVLCALLVAAAVGCKKEPDFVDTTVKDIPKDNEVAEPVVPDVPEVSENTEEQQLVVEEPKFYNSLTGLECSEEISQNRPVAVMLNNIKEAMPQIGIARADIIYEVLEEGGITRLMGVFKDYADIPELGSIRSSRDYYIDLSDAHNAIYVHCGGSTYAKSMLANRGTENIDGLYVRNFYRSAERAKTMVYEHTLMISGEGLTKAIEAAGYETKLDVGQPLQFVDKINMAPFSDAYRIDVPFSLALDETPYAHTYFEYDEENAVYLKNHYDTKHIDGATGEQLGFTNVITLECKQWVIPNDPYGCLSVDFTGEGKGFYAADGKIKPVVWKKASRTVPYELYEEDGETPLYLKQGKTYIGIVPTGTKVTATEKN